MKKFFKSLCISLVSVFCLVSMFGCSCSKPMDVYYTINLSNELDSTQKTKINMMTTITKKFREPAGTPCYEKIIDIYVINEDLTKLLFKDEEIAVINNKTFTLNNIVFVINDDVSKVTSYDGTIEYDINNNKFTIVSYSLMKNSKGVAECYNEKGEYFERATSKNVDKVTLATEHPINIAKSNTSYESSKQEVPKEVKYSLIYQFDIKNKESQTLYIKTLSVNSILNGQINEDGLQKIKAIFPSDDKIVIIENDSYYSVAPEETITIILEFKGLIKSDSVENKKDLNLNINLITRK